MGLAAVPWDRRQTYEAGGLGVPETPELGRLAHEHICGSLADAWNARQDVGGKYWPEAGNGAPKATGASPAANRTALVFMDAFLTAERL